jgi:cytochrome P450
MITPNIPKDIATEIVDPKAYADGGRVDAAFSWLRREMPLAVAQPDGCDPFWVVTRHADILEVERNNELFHNGDTFTTFTTIEGGEKVKQMTGGSPHLIRSLVQMDNPDHMNYRRLTQSWFMPQNLRKLEPRIREIARGFVDGMAALGDKCDFARDVAFLYPLHVVMEVLGVPESDEHRMLKLTQELFGSQDPDLNRDGKEVESADAALAASLQLEQHAEVPVQIHPRYVYIYIM